MLGFRGGVYVGKVANIPIRRLKSLPTLNISGKNTQHPAQELYNLLSPVESLFNIFGSVSCGSGVLR